MLPSNLAIEIHICGLPTTWELIWGIGKRYGVMGSNRASAFQRARRRVGRHRAQNIRLRRRRNGSEQSDRTGKTFGHLRSGAVHTQCADVVHHLWRAEFIAGHEPAFRSRESKSMYNRDPTSASKGG